MSALERQIAMLRAIPRSPQRISVQALSGRLSADGYDVTVRTIQRDLNDLSRQFGLQCDIEGRTQFWYFDRDYRGFDIPGMAPEEALVLRMSEIYLAAALPAAQLQRLQPLFDRARDCIEQSDIPLARWRRRVRVINRGPPLKIPSIAPGIVEAVHEGLIRQKRVALRYRKRGEKSARDYEASIHALVVLDGLVYAVATLWDFKDLLHLVLHRAVSAEVLDVPATNLPEFDIDCYIEKDGVLSWPDEPGKRILLELSVANSVAEHLTERPLSDDQVCEPIDQARWRVRATVIDTRELHWWLRALGANVEVLAPAKLRRSMGEEMRRAAEQYEATW